MTQLYRSKLRIKNLPEYTEAAQYTDHLVDNVYISEDAKYYIYGKDGREYIKPGDYIIYYPNRLYCGAFEERIFIQLYRPATEQEARYYRLKSRISYYIKTTSSTLFCTCIGIIVYMVFKMIPRWIIDKYWYGYGDERKLYRQTRYIKYFPKYTYAEQYNGRVIDGVYTVEGRHVYFGNERQYLSIGDYILYHHYPYNMAVSRYTFLKTYRPATVYEKMYYMLYLNTGKIFNRITYRIIYYSLCIIYYIIDIIKLKWIRNRK